MRHKAFGRKLGRTTAHRLALFRNQLASLVAEERITTTLPKAKELRPIAERAVTQGKRGTVHARRLVGRWLASRNLIKKLFDEIAPRFSERAGGCLRIVKLGPRPGDGAEMAILEFVDYDPKKKAAGKAKPAAGGKEPEKAAPAKEARAEEKAPAAEKKEAAKASAKQAPAKKASKPKAAAAPKKPAAKQAAPKAEAKPSKGKAAPAPKKGSTPKKVGS